MKEKKFKFNDKWFKVILPTPRIREEADEEEVKVFSDGLRPKDLGGKGLLTQEQMEKILRDNKIWGDDEQRALDDVRVKIAELLDKLEKEKGSKKFEKIYTKIKEYRNKEQALLSKYDYYFSRTVDARARNARLMYLVASCIRNEDGSKVWNNFDDFKQEEDFDFVGEATRQAMSFFLNLDVDILTYPEDRLFQERQKENKKSASPTKS